MQTLRSRLALLLLLCFTRVLLPQAWELRLHDHAHTTHEPSVEVGPLHGKTVLSAQHQHCPTDSFWHVPFQPATPPVLPTPFRGYAAAAAPAPLAEWSATVPPAADSRGPPRRA